MIEIRLEGPGKNALGTPLMTSVLRQLEAARGAPVLLRGHGDAFSAGLDLKEVLSLDGPGMERFLRLLGDLAAALFDHPGPTVALVNGHAIAGGCVLALCCDARVGVRAPRARLGLNEVALGLRFPGRLLRILRHQAPALDRLVLGAALHDPEAALALGVLDALAPDEVAAEAQARERLAALAALPPAAYAAAKADLRRGVSRTDDAEEAAFLRDVLPAWTSDELKARIRAVLKR